MEPIDVVMLTKNSGHLLKECLASVYDNVPVKRLIVVDGISTDDTIKILSGINKEYGNVKIIDETGSRAKARERGIKEVKTEWFMFVDSDVILCKNWFKKAERNITKEVGAIWGLNIDVAAKIINNGLLLKSQALIARQCFELRGGMHDTLIRSELVKDIRIPEQLHAYEDAYIVNWIKKKGYKVTMGNNLYCLHYKSPESWSLKNGVQQATLEIKCGLVYSHIFKYAFYYPFFMFHWLLQLLSPKSSNYFRLRASQR